ncbi:MAG: hypothetical protein HN509_00840 [Halobacteriovoraceae bacterium]|jgi:hypothetical protein|nr:hypothetical protein [Halobacteriovoraceae bacterium]MBT5095279.1 hypothetical protein [Halobacteriovoraceae bacterium]
MSRDDKNFFVKIIMAVFIFAGFSLALLFLIKTGNNPWFENFLAIDGPSYLKGIDSILNETGFIRLKDIYHSAGYQIYLASIKLLLPEIWEQNFILIVKLLSFLIFTLTGGLIFHLGKKLLGVKVALLALFLMAFSAKFHIYNTLLQGEVLQAFFLSLVAFFLYKEYHSTKKLKYWIFLGILSSVICLFQTRFLLLIPCLVIYLFYRANSLKAIDWKQQTLGFGIPILLILGGWCFEQTVAHGELVVVSKGSDFRLRSAYSPASMGYAFPYPELKEPSGVNFILENPLQTIWLFKERFLYFWDIKSDVWNLGNPFLFLLRGRIATSSIDGILQFFFMLMFFFGIFSSFRGERKILLFHLLLPLLINFIGPFLVFGSSRFLIPGLPIVFLFQANGLYQIGTWILKKKDGLLKDHP